MPLAMVVPFDGTSAHTAEQSFLSKINNVEHGRKLKFFHASAVSNKTVRILF